MVSSVEQNTPTSNMAKSPSADHYFPAFSRLPKELRESIWRYTLRPRIIKWIRQDDRNVFSVPSKSLPIFDVSRESRAAAVIYGKYRDISTTSTPLYFSPVIDYLLFDPVWADLVDRHPPPALAGGGPILLFGGGLTALVPRDPPTDPLNGILPEMSDVHNIMVHPNYSDMRKKPTALLERLPSLEKILVAADEKSIGFRSELMLATVYDLQKYYAYGAKTRIPELKVPYIAVGCLGWIGDERRKMHHEQDDSRQLVAVFDNAPQMKSYLSILREEEWNFTKEQLRHRPQLKFTLKFRQPQSDPLTSSSTPNRANLTRAPTNEDPIADGSTARNCSSSIDDASTNGSTPEIAQAEDLPIQNTTFPVMHRVEQAISNGAQPQSSCRLTPSTSTLTTMQMVEQTLTNAQLQSHDQIDGPSTLSSIVTPISQHRLSNIPSDLPPSYSEALTTTLGELSGGTEEN